MINQPIKVGIFPVSENAKAPTKSTQFAACLDLQACIDCDEIQTYDALNRKVSVPVVRYLNEDITLNSFNIEPGSRALVSTGYIFDIPEGYSLRIHPRSGLSLKKHLVICNAEGVIDHDYVDPSFILLTNNSSAHVNVNHHERLAQIEIVKDLPVEFVEIPIAPQQRGNRVRGIGSTGT